MSKKAERRKILELEAEVKRLGSIIENIQDDRDPERDERLVDMKYVGIIFDKEAYKKGENELNDLLASGYKIVRDHRTDSGIVIAAGLYESKKSRGRT